VGGVPLCKFSPIGKISGSVAHSPCPMESFKFLELSFDVGCGGNNLYLLTAADQAGNINESVCLGRMFGRNRFHVMDVR
jgi:hypothetical protein